MPNVRNNLAPSAPADLAAMDLAELEAALAAIGHPAFHARQICRQLLPPRMRAPPPGVRLHRQRLPRALRLHFQIADARLLLQ